MAPWYLFLLAARFQLKFREGMDKKSSILHTRFWWWLINFGQKSFYCKSHWLGMENTDLFCSCCFLYFSRTHGKSPDNVLLLTLIPETEETYSLRPLTVKTLSYLSNVLPLYPLNHAVIYSCLTTTKSKVVMSPPGQLSRPDKYY